MAFETERLILRRWEDSDAEDLYKYASNPDVGPIAGWPAHQSIDESRNVIKNVFCGKEAYAICLKGDDKAIGAIELKLNGHTDMTDRDDECELGYWLGKPFWGRGIMPEAVREMLRHAFEDCGMEKVWCGYYEGNTKSKRVQEKCGFVYQWRSEDVDVPLMHEKRTGHVSLMTKEDWLLTEIQIELQDTEWPCTYTDHDRQIARAVVFDDDGYFYFVRAERDDDFGKATFIETSGGGVEPGEDLISAIRRELKEELGAEAEVVCKIGVVSDYYNLIHRHNLNHYFLCRVKSFGDKNLTRDEIEDFRLSTLKMTYEEAVAEYEKRKAAKLGRLIANRELPILRRAKEIIG